MNTFLLSYDLIGPETKYEYLQLIEKIKTFESWARPLQSVWIVKTYLTRREVYDRLNPFLDLNDKILIIDLSGGWISKNMSPQVVDWLKTEIKSY